MYNFHQQLRYCRYLTAIFEELFEIWKTVELKGTLK